MGVSFPPLFFPSFIFPHLRSIHDQALSLGLEPRSVTVQDGLEAASLGNWVVMMLFTDVEGWGLIGECNGVSFRPAAS